jgi:hypothetical protein
MTRSVRRRRLRAVLGLASTVIAAIALAPASARAQYLDPGAGSVIVQAVVALVVGLGVTTKLYWHRISSLFRIRPPRDRGR